jgi:hypothetical protein
MAVGVGQVGHDRHDPGATIRQLCGQLVQQRSAPGHEHDPDTTRRQFDRESATESL